MESTTMTGNSQPLTSPSLSGYTQNGGIGQNGLGHGQSVGIGGNLMTTGNLNSLCGHCFSYQCRCYNRPYYPYYNFDTTQVERLAKEVGRLEAEIAQLKEKLRELSK